MSLTITILFFTQNLLFIDTTKSKASSLFGIGNDVFKGAYDSQLLTKTFAMAIEGCKTIEEIDKTIGEIHAGKKFLTNDDTDELRKLVVNKQYELKEKK